MDEFRKLKDKSRTIGTFGVSTCTAIIISMPGKFSYLAHASTYDRIYKGKMTDLISNMLKQIRTFDIYRYEERKLEFIIIARHTDSIFSALDLITEKGFLLSQIKFLYNSKAVHANVFYNLEKNTAEVNWRMKSPDKHKKFIIQNSNTSEKLSTILKKIRQHK